MPEISPEGPLPPHIFDSEHDAPSGPAYQRRLGFFLSHEINPCAVLNTTVDVIALSADRVRISYDAVLLADGEADFSPLIPSGTWCMHGGSHHKVVTRRIVDTPFSEIAVESPNVTNVTINHDDVARAVSRVTTKFVQGGRIA